MKKNRFFFEKYWKKLVTGCILYVLFTVFCAVTAAETSSVNATVRLADPETENVLAQYRKQLARQTAEIEKLKTENIQKQTENAQRTVEISTLVTEKNMLAAEIERLKNEFTKLKGDLETDKILLEESNQNLRGELLDTLERCAKLSNRLKRIEQSAAGVLETLNPVYTGQREVELADALDLAMQCGMNLVSRSTNVCDFLYPRLGKLGLAAVEEARLRVAVDELAAMNRNFARLSVPAAEPEGMQKCRILEVRDTPEMIVVNAGYRNGVRVNMILRTGDGQNSCRLRVIAVRPFVAAAVVEQGRLKDLSQGMELLMTDKNNKQ